MKITEQKFAKLNEQDRLQLAALLIKAGYTVRITKEKLPGKTANIICTEFWGQVEEQQRDG